MNTEATKTVVMNQTSTAVLIESARKLMAITSPTNDETRVLGWTLGELFDRCPEMRAAVEAAL